ncbi:hypothetical protein ALTERO38_60671 [Alteromonas sp. 38]|nr:hypothetical protein ALTER154_40123 [Alteromonas sp. 154]VXC29669.1 hypothetical protein ALTERO38_60671 [Alteromonas sp. 38]
MRLSLLTGRFSAGNDHSSKPCSDRLTLVLSGAFECQPNVTPNVTNVTLIAPHVSAA